VVGAVDGMHHHGTMNRRQQWWVLPHEGQEPDYRFTLANERTFLAWIRTSLGLLAGGIAVGELVSEFEIGWMRTAISIAAITASGIVAVGAFLRWVQVQHAVRRGEPLPPTPLVPFLAAGILLIGLLAIIANVHD
jgi:putative membrane protein